MAAHKVAPGEQETNLFNILRFMVRNPAKTGVLVRKIVDRFTGSKLNAPSAENTAWIEAHSEDAASIGRRIAPELWKEAEQFAAETRKRGAEILKTVPFDLGGGGDFRLLYWLVRLYGADVVVETGVAAGWTSQAILAAMRENGKGTLYSSDFPYFRIENPESYIGCVVEPSLRANWKLYLEGDAKALPKIAAAVPKVDLFHYDSDKSWAGRDKAIALMREKLSPGGLILMDDILNNSWFRTYVEREKVPFTVVGNRVGVIGEFRRPG